MQGGGGIAFGGRPKERGSWPGGGRGTKHLSVLVSEKMDLFLHPYAPEPPSQRAGYSSSTPVEPAVLTDHGKWGLSCYLLGICSCCCKTVKTESKQDPASASPPGRCPACWGRGRRREARQEYVLTTLLETCVKGSISSIFCLEQAKTKWKTCHSGWLEDMSSLPSSSLLHFPGQLHIPTHSLLKKE